MVETTDLFPDNPTQYADADGDGLEMLINPEQMPIHPCLMVIMMAILTMSTYLPNIVSGDLDNDGVPDELDAFPEDYHESSDADGDGEGDNADVDDDNDGWTDIDELRQGSDPFSSSENR